MLKFWHFKVMQNFGLSGDNISVSGDFVIKICQTNQDRFLKNIKKQIDFNNQYIKSVPIIEQGLIDNKNYIKMPFIRNANCLLWLQKLNIDQLNKFIDKILNYFKSNLNVSEVKDFGYNIWVNKIDDLISKIYNNDIKCILKNLKLKKFNNKFYYGNYHGDFNFLNLLVDNDDIYAIDFLDSFINSPINDIVKLRQDTFHCFSIELIEQNDINKLIIIFNYIDEKIKSFIISDKILSEYYISFQLINLIRILPYTKDQKIYNYLVKEIKDLYANIDNSICW